MDDSRCTCRGTARQKRLRREGSRERIWQPSYRGQMCSSGLPTPVGWLDGRAPSPAGNGGSCAAQVIRLFISSPSSTQHLPPRCPCLEHSPTPPSRFCCSPVPTLACFTRMARRELCVCVCFFFCFQDVVSSPCSTDYCVTSTGSGGSGGERGEI
jgi:hypothetical protein